MKSLLDKFNPNPFHKYPAPKGLDKKLRLDPRYTYYILKGPGITDDIIPIGPTDEIDNALTLSTSVYNEGVAVGIKLGMEILDKHIQEQVDGKERAAGTTKRAMEPARKQDAKKAHTRTRSK